jgi:hypothetical protein
MRTTNATPSIAADHDVTVHIALDDFGKLGRAYRETDEANTSLRDVIDDLLTGQYSSPIRVVAFNTSEGWARDASEDVARDVIRRSGSGGLSLPETMRKFIEFHIGAEETLRAENDFL